jgi:hypothetical protein
MKEVLASLARFKAQPSPKWLAPKTSAFPVDSQAILDDFLHSDLSQTSTATVLPGDFTLPRFQFVSSVLLQVHEIVDITLPTSQRLNLEISSNPTFKLLLSDGFSSIVAITKGLFPQFSPALLPGVKLIVHQGCVARYGVVFLESYQNIEIIGGYSPILIEKCASILVNQPIGKIDDPPPAPLRTLKQKDPCTLNLVPHKVEPRPTSFLESDGEEFETLADEIDQLTFIPTVEDFKTKLPIGQSNVKGSVRRYGLLEIRKRGAAFVFSLDIVIGEQQHVMSIQASPELLEFLLKSSARAWLDLSPKEQEKRFLNCCKELLAMKSPLRLEVRSPSQIFLLPPLTF